MPIKHILWDWNGTLLDDVDLCVNATNSLLKSQNLPAINRQFYRTNFTFPVNLFYEKAGLDIKNDFATYCQIWNDYYYSGFEKTLPLREGAKKIINNIQTLGIEQSILSACQHNILIDSLRILKIFDYFKFVYGNQKFQINGKQKIAEELIKKIPLPTKEILIIGDTHHDYEVAMNLNLSCIIFKEGYVTAKRLSNLPVQQVDALAPILSFLN